MSSTFGVQTLAVYGSGPLLVPSTQSLSGIPVASTVPAIDHIACYTARAVDGLRSGPQQTVTLQDLFGSYTPVVGRPTRLCLPADIDGASPGAETHPDVLLCYRIKRLPVQIGRVFAADELGTETLVPRFLQELCVPSARR